VVEKRSHEVSGQVNELFQNIDTQFVKMQELSESALTVFGRLEEEYLKLAERLEKYVADSNVTVTRLAQCIADMDVTMQPLADFSADCSETIKQINQNAGKAFSEITDAAKSLNQAIDELKHMGEENSQN